MDRLVVVFVCNMCYSPIYLKSKNLYVDCRKCFECRQKIARLWSIRLSSELTTNPYSIFITLTFSEEYYDTATINKRDVQLFLKRLRKKLKNRMFKYFAVGEYGDESHRKHYHLILFNVGFYDISKISDCWKYGNVDFGAVQGASIAYVSGYVNKKIDTEESKDFYDSDYQPAFRLMSKKLGLSFIYENMDSYLRDKSFTYSGKSYPLPRYFRNKLGLILDNPYYSDFISDKQYRYFLKLSDRLSLDFDGDVIKFIDKLYEIGYFLDRQIYAEKRNERIKRSKI